MLNIVKKIFGTKNDRELKRLWPLVHRVNELESSLSSLSDEELREKTAAFRARVFEATKAERDALEALREQSRQPHAEDDGEAPEDLREAVTNQEKALY